MCTRDVCLINSIIIKKSKPTRYTLAFRACCEGDFQCSMRYVGYLQHKVTVNLNCLGFILQINKDVVL